MSSTLTRPFGFLARRAAAACALVLGAFALTAVAQEPEIDPPGRVARVSEATGQVWIYTPDAGEWISAARNQPLTSGDRIATDTGARAELQIGSTSLRLDSGSELEVVQLDDAQAALQLLEGSAIARVRDAEGAGELEVSTDEGRFLVQRSGTYRIDRVNGKSDMTVYAGEARYEGPNSGLPVRAGQRAEFWIDSGGVAQYSLFAPVNDAFAGWSSERDRRYVGSVAERYVSPEMSGAAELDAYGRWEQTTDYGAVWYPTAVAVDWAPYSHGHWTWVRPWGWTWVDDAPWGFAPFHYGRWVYLRNRWCWTPGQRVHRPVYAPALVAWVGGSRGNVSVTVGGGPAVGWFPLAPREVYVPGYRVSPRYARNVNITNVTNVTVINNAFANPQSPREFENRRQPRAVTVVPTGVMTERRPVAPAAAQYRQAPAVRELISQPARVVAQVTAPVAAPTPPARGAETRDVRPPPGFPGRAENAGRPGGDPRATRPESGTPPRPGTTAQPGAVQAREQAAAAPNATPPTPAGVQLPTATTAPGQQPGAINAPGQPSAATTAPRAIPAPPGRPGFNGDDRQRPDRNGQPPARGRGDREPGDRDPGNRPGAPAVVQPGSPSVVQPAAPQVTAPTPVAPPTAPAVQMPRPAAAPQPVQEAPMMRPLPVQRGDERRREDRFDERRRDERGGDERRGAPAREPDAARPSMQVQPQPPAAPAAVQRPVEVQRPVAPPPAAQPAPMPRSVDMQRPAPQQQPPQAVQRPVDIQRPAPAVQPPPVQRPVELPRPAVAPPAPPPVQRVEPPRAPEQRGQRPDNPRGGDDNNRRGDPRDQR